MNKNDDTNKTKQKIRSKIFGALDKFFGKKIIIFGAGNFGRDIFLLLNYIGVDIAYIIDNNHAKQGFHDVYKKEIQNIDALQNEDKQKILIIAAVGDSSSIIKSLTELGFIDGVNFIDANIEFAPYMKKNCDCSDPQLVYTRKDDIGSFKVYKSVKDNPELKILVLGASHTDWSFYSLKSWPEMLFETVAEKKNIELYNGAIYGYTSIQELCKLMRDSLQFKPDIVVNYSGSNDAALPQNKNPRRRAAGYFCSPGELHFGFNTPCYAPEARTRNIECAEGIKPYGSNKNNSTSYTKNNATNATVWLDNMRMMNAVCTEFGIKFMAFLQPSLFVSKYMQSGDVNLYKLFETEEERVKLFYNEVLKNIQDKNYIIDLHTIFDNENDIYIDGIHYTEKAHAIVANCVLEKIKCVI
ncbi:MAG: hypothetical protein Ta2B_08970 [Termitinemataceae bacterium]|nr:MAG: hypothetical protein Ta2B_08970 [Termitinemataceae bacterium]